MIKYLIIDDEPIAHRIIEGYCAKLSHLEKIGNCYNPIEAISFFGKNQVDLIFLDINMPKLSGFEFLRTLPKPPNVIVTTAYTEFAIEGYELNVVDYLLKPFSFDRFIQAINKISAPNFTNSEIPDIRENKRIFLKGDKKYHQIPIDQIISIEAYGNYSKVHLINDQTLLTHHTMTNFEKKLPSAEFIRVHKSYIVSISKIKIIEGNRVKIGGGRELPIGQTYRNAVQLLINDT